MAKNDPKWQKIISVAFHITTHHLIVIYSTLLWNDNLSRHFFHFSKFWFSGFLGRGEGVNGQKMVQNEKKFCLLHSISQESYTISLPFIVHMGKIISPSFFYISSKFWFSGLFGRQKGKKQSKMRKKIPFVMLHISGTIHHMIFIYGTYI